MIPIVFLLVLVGLMVGMSIAGVGPGNHLIGEVLLLVGLFLLFFGAGIYVGAALGVLGLIVGFAFSDRPFWTFIGQTVWNPSSSFVLVAVPLFLLMGEILLRAGLSDRLLQGAECVARSPARWTAAHQHRGLGRVLSHLRLLRRHGRDDGLGRAALLQGLALRSEDGARLARRRRRARQPHPARHHIHHLRADHRDFGRRALSRRGRPQHPRRCACSCW